MSQKKLDENLKKREVKVWLGDEGLLYVLIKGWFEKEETPGILNKVKDEIDNIYKEHIEEKFKVLVDVSELLGPPPPSTVREGWLEIVKDERIGKLAWWGAHTIEKVVISFIMAASGKKNIKFFKTKEESLKWLKS